MMTPRIVLLPLALLAGTSLSGCVAAVIPAIAGSTMVGSRVIDNEAGDAEPAAEPAPAVAAAAPPAPPVAAAKPAPVPTVTVALPPRAPAPVPAPVVPSTAEPAPLPAAVPPPAPMLTTAPARIEPVAPPPAIIQAPAQPRTAPSDPGPMAPPIIADVGPPPAAAAASATAASAMPPARAYPDPANPLPSDQLGFARFVRHGQASARGMRESADLPSAVLSDPVALDGKRRRCAAGEQPVAVIDLDPRGGLFAPPANPGKLPGIALGLAVLREAGVEIAWMSDLSTDKSGLLRTALEQSGLDPRGEDIISLRRDEADTKQKRRDSLAGITCIVAIAGDERADFDERFKYLRTPEAGAGLEPLFGDGWFLTEPLLGKEGQ